MIYVLVVWTASGPIFAICAFQMWLKRNRVELPPLRNLVGLVSLVVVLASWILFGLLAYCGRIGGFGTHYITLRPANTFFMITSCAAASCSAFKGESRTFSMISGFLMAALWAGALLVA
jgi:hypothetical protein